LTGGRRGGLPWFRRIAVPPDRGHGDPVFSQETCPPFSRPVTKAESREAAKPACRMAVQSPSRVDGAVDRQNGHASIRRPN
jgi:hypothetical protein